MNPHRPSCNTHTLHRATRTRLSGLLAVAAVLTANGAIPARAPLALMNRVNVTIISEDRREVNYR